MHLPPKIVAHLAVIVLFDPAIIEEQIVLVIKLSEPPIIELQPPKIIFLHPPAIIFNLSEALPIRLLLTIGLHFFRFLFMLGHLLKI